MIRATERHTKLLLFIEKIFKSNINIFVFAVGSVILSRLLMLLLCQLWGYGADNLIELLTKYFDNGWIRGVIIDGYMYEPSMHEKGDAANWPVFPLVPMLIKFVAYITSLPINTVGFCLNTVFLICSNFVAMKYIMLTRDNKKLAILFAMVMSFGPYTFYFSSLYTESLYLLLLLMCYYFLKKRKYILMGLCGGLLSATRNTGIFFVFVIAFVVIKENWTKEKNLLKVIKNILRDEKLILGTVLVPFGMFSYMSYLWQLTGDPFAFMHVEKAWGFGDIKNPITLLVSYFRTDSVRQWYLAIFVLVACGIIVYQIFNRKIEEMILPIIIMIIIITTHYSYIPRYMISSGMFLLATLEYILNQFSKKAKILCVVLGVIWSVCFLKMWFLGDNLLT